MSDWFVVGYFGIGVIAFIIAACCYAPPNGNYSGYSRDWSMEWLALFMWPLFLIFFGGIIVAMLLFYKPEIE